MRSLDLQYIDPLLLAFRQGLIRQDIQREAILAAARAASDAMSFMTALNNFGVARKSQLYNFLGEYMASPTYFRAKYPKILGLRQEGEAPEPFLTSSQTFFLVEPVLSEKAFTAFSDAYWWFVNNHKISYLDTRKGTCIGVYKDEPKDNASTLARFEDYLQRLISNSSQRIRDIYADLPLDIILSLLRRTFL